ncbi:MAG: DUF393 domain-containing protein [Acidobacteriota bacterium]|nr:DUF393 domain-containing protein [Acidobacteriota bacterium]
MSTHYLLYDDKCPMCTFQMRTLIWLDWFDILTMVPISHEKAAQLAPGIGREDLLEAIHCVSNRGKIHRGARALRFVCMRLVLGIPMALVLWIPGVIQIAELIYRWISKNRHLLSRFFGCKEACTIMPVRERKNESVLKQ